MKLKVELLFRSSLFAAMILGLSSCSTSTKRSDRPSSLVSSSLKLWKPMTFESHPDWVGLNLDPEPTTQLRKDLEVIRGSALKSRGEAHVTVITPPEFKILSEHLGMQEIEAVAQSMSIQTTPFNLLCLAEATHPKESKLQTYFIVVESPGLLEIRREIFRRFVAAGGDPHALGNANYFPHITVGFSDRDLYDSDGILKDRRYCIMDLTTADGKPITHWNQY